MKRTDSRTGLGGKVVVGAVLALGVTGWCGGAAWGQPAPNMPAGKPGVDRGYDPPKMPAVPPVPPVRAVPIDQALRGTARDTILKFAADKVPVIRANAIEGASRNFAAEDARAVVLRGLSDEAAVVRFTACIAAGDLKFADARAMLLRLAYDNDSNVRVAARYALHKIGDRALSQEMLLGLRDERAGVRSNTVMLLGMLGERSAVGPLRRLLTDGMASVRLQAAEALWRLGDDAVADDLVARTVSKYPDEQIVALVALAQPREPRDSRVISNIRGLLVAEFPEVELAAARAAGMLGSDDGYGVALKYATADEPRQRALSALALGDIRRADAQDVLKKLLEDKNPEVRLAAATALMKLREAAR